MRRQPWYMAVVTGVAGLVEGTLRAVDRFQRRHALFGVPFAVVKKAGEDRVGQHAALLAYYGFLSLFPLMLVFVTVLGYALAGNEELQRRVIDAAIAQFPVLGTQIEDSIKSIEGSGLGLVIGILGTLWGGLGITSSTQEAMNEIWNVPRRVRPGFWLRIVRSLASLLLVVAALLVATALAQMGTAGPGLGGNLLPLIGSLLLNMLLLAGGFKVLTGTSLPWRWLLPGAVVGGVGWSTLQALGAHVVGRQLDRANLVYGVFAVVIVLLSWLYLSAQLLLYSAEINVVLARRLWPRGLVRPWTEQDRLVLTALAEVEERLAEQQVQVRFGAKPEPEGRPDGGGGP
jgi:YihY family inner membrane protein